MPPQQRAPEQHLCGVCVAPGQQRSARQQAPPAEANPSRKLGCLVLLVLLPPFCSPRAKRAHPSPVPRCQVTWPTAATQSTGLANLLKWRVRTWAAAAHVGGPTRARKIRLSSVHCNGGRFGTTRSWMPLPCALRTCSATLTQAHVARVTRLGDPKRTVTHAGGQRVRRRVVGTYLARTSMRRTAHLTRRPRVTAARAGEHATWSDRPKSRTQAPSSPVPTEMRRSSGSLLPGLHPVQFAADTDAVAVRELRHNLRHHAAALGAGRGTVPDAATPSTAMPGSAMQAAGELPSATNNSAEPCQYSAGQCPTPLPATSFTAIGHKRVVLSPSHCSLCRSRHNQIYRPSGGEASPARLELAHER